MVLQLNKSEHKLETNIISNAKNYHFKVKMKDRSTKLNQRTKDVTMHINKMKQSITVIKMTLIILLI